MRLLKTILSKLWKSSWIFWFSTAMPPILGRGRAIACAANERRLAVLVNPKAPGIKRTTSEL